MPTTTACLWFPKANEGDPDEYWIKDESRDEEESHETFRVSAIKFICK
jgi:hypothetical protein